MPIYLFKHPKTGKIFEDIRSFKDFDKPFISPDGETCDRIIPGTEVNARKRKGRASRAGMKLEVFQADPQYVRRNHPKYVRFRDGHREKYDPTKHC